MSGYLEQMTPLSGDRFEDASSVSYLIDSVTGQTAVLPFQCVVSAATHNDLPQELVSSGSRHSHSCLLHLLHGFILVISLSNALLAFPRLYRLGFNGLHEVPDTGREYLL